MKKWEYKFINGDELNEKKLEAILNELGKNGWRLTPNEPPIAGPLFIMEREIPEPTKQGRSRGFFDPGFAKSRSHKS